MTPSAEISKLVGTWEVMGEHPAGCTFLSTIRIDERGAYVAHVVLEGGAVTKTVDMEGIFRVEDGVLVDTQTKGSNTKASLPRTIRSRIVRLESREMVIHWEPTEEINVPVKDVVFRRIEK